jgi:glutathione synthase/RimK-type ligase-like ATP-grasp enzyme
MSRSIAFATDRNHAALTQDDQQVAICAAELGITVAPAVWNDPDVVWERFDAVVIRSCWDYHLHPTAFLDWLARLEQKGISLWNPPPIVRWNSDKRYLLELAQWGVATVPTIYLPHGATADLGGLLAEQGWTEVVVKPTISASAFNTWRGGTSTLSKDHDRFAEQVRHSATLVQPYMPEIEAGEWSLVYFNGTFSHAALKRPKTGEFRVQGEFGGQSTLAPPDTALIEQGSALIDLVQSRFGQPLLYTRVDGVVRAGQLVLMELELIEPALLLALEPSSAERFARAIQDIIFSSPL